jgi:hypothetical protein
MSFKPPYDEVPLATPQTSPSPCFIDSASTVTFLSSAAMLFSFLLMHFYAALRAPPLFDQDQKYFKLNLDNTNSTVSIALSISEIQPSHRFLEIECFLIGQVGHDLPMQISVRQRKMRNHGVVESPVRKDENRLVRFQPGQTSSEAFPIACVEVIEMDTLNLRVNAKADFAGIDGFMFNWCFGTTGVGIYENTVRVFQMLLLGYMLVLFVTAVELDGFTRIYLVVMGGLGVLACDPIGLLLPRFGRQMGAEIFRALFLAAYRLFVVIELRLIATRKRAGSDSVVIVGVVIGTVYAAIEAVALYNRSVEIKQARPRTLVVLQSEQAAACAHVFYIVFSVVCLVVACVKTDKTAGRRLSFFGFSVILSGVITAIAKVGTRAQGLVVHSLVPDVAYSSVHVTLAAMTLFLMRPASGKEYKDLEDEAPEMRNTGLDIEQISDGANGEDGFHTHSAEEK